MGRRRPDAGQPVSVWSEKDVIDGKVVDALVVILRSRGCYWSRQSGCLMCGYNNDCLDSVTADDLAAQFGKAMERHSGQDYIKIYTSGSFLDPNEVPPEAFEKILAMAGDRAGKVLVESRPEFVSQSVLLKADPLVRHLEIAIGLETANDDIRASRINKGFRFSDFKRACETASESGASTRAYLLMKPPYTSEGGAIADVLDSICKVANLSQTISINPMNVQRGTVVEGLWKRGLYRPPWLWSLLSATEKGAGLTDARLVSAPSGGGSRRGVHNCGQCDRRILDAIEKFSLGGDPKALKVPGCGCREQWLDLLDVEQFTGTTGDLERLAPPQ